MHAVVTRDVVDTAPLSVSIGRHMTTSFIVPLPTRSGLRAWNMTPLGKPVRKSVISIFMIFFEAMTGLPKMTQCVQKANQTAILHEANVCIGRRIVRTDDLRTELRTAAASRLGVTRQLASRWPVYLVIQFPERSPAEWLGIIGSRLMNTLVPQLQGAGFYPRPLCVDTPGYIVLLWPQEALVTTHARSDAVIPLQERLLPCLFAMLKGAYDTIWEGGQGPAIMDILPRIDVQLSTHAYPARSAEWHVIYQ